MELLPESNDAIEVMLGLESLFSLPLYAVDEFQLFLETSIQLCTS
jgi:hypothetical protein